MKATTLKSLQAEQEDLLSIQASHLLEISKRIEDLESELSLFENLDFLSPEYYSLLAHLRLQMNNFELIKKYSPLFANLSKYEV